MFGDTGDQLVTEESPTGTKGFLAESCIKWEEAFYEINEPGLRTGMVIYSFTIPQLLSGSKKNEKKIEKAGFKFTYPELEGALRSWKRII